MFNRLFLLLVFTAVFSATTFAAGPKYGKFAEPLSSRSNAEYFKKNDAADFWAMMPFYTGQKLGQQCTAATFTMVLNAARGSRSLDTDTPLLTIESFLEKYAEKKYSELLSHEIQIVDLFIGKLDRSVIGNRHLVEVLKQAVSKLGLQNAKTQVELFPVDVKNKSKLAEARKQFHDALVANEKSANDFLILSAFVQGKLTGDAEGFAHAAPIGAYDESKRLVLVMDPDREWYEPYWVPEDKVFDALATHEADAAQPGWIRYQVR